MPPGATTLACVGTARAAAALSGPSREAAVVADGPHAVYAQDGDDVVAVLAAGAVEVPIGLRTSSLRLPRHDGALVLGGGQVRIGTHTWRVTRLVDRRVPRLPALARTPPPPPAVTDPLVAGVRELVPGDALDLLLAGDPGAVPRLLGLGPGLTPVGDDVLAGWLVADHALGGGEGPVRDAVAELAADRTTAVSDALLRRALDGEAVPPLAAVLRAMARPGDAAPALRALVDVGDTSGAGLLLGVLTRRSAA